MSILSSIKSAGQKVATGVYNTVNKVGSAIANTGGNLAKQASALSSSLGSQSVKNASMASVAGAFSPAPNSTSATTKQPVYSGGGTPNATSVATKQPINTSTSIGNQYSALERSTSAPSSVNVSSSRGGGSGSSLSDYLSGSSPEFSGSGYSAQNVQTSTPSFSSYKGKTGTDSTTYYGGTPLSLEAQANNQSNGVDPSVAARRDSNRSVIATEEADAPRRKAEAEAAAAEASKIKAAADAAAQASVMTGENQDPAAQAERAALEKEARDLERQYQAMQRQVEELSKPSAEYLAALEEEKQLTEQENSVKTGLSTALNEVNNQPVSQGFLTGQGARLQNLANTDLGRIAGQKVTLQQRLATEQQRRQAAMDVAKIGLTRAGSRADTASNRAFEYGQSVTKRKQDKADKTYSVSAGETIYDSKGNVIAKGAYKPTEVSNTEKATNEVNGAISQFKTLMQAKGWRGVSPDDYQTMASYLQKTYGYKAVAELQSAMKANGMQVDDVNFDGGGGA